MKKNAHAFVNQLLVFCLVTLCAGGSVGLGLVWLRHQISVTANTNRVLQARLADVERQIEERTALIENEKNPANLRRLNEEMHIGLVSMVSEQVVPVPDANLGERLAARANRELFKDVVPPPTIQFVLNR